MRRENVLKEHFEQINIRPEFFSYKDQFLRNRWVNMSHAKVDEFFNQTFEKINDSFNGNIDNVIRILEDKINQLKNL